jgi:hypothetical protein
VNAARGKKDTAEEEEEKEKVAAAESAQAGARDVQVVGGKPSTCRGAADVP